MRGSRTCGFCFQLSGTASVTSPAATFRVLLSGSFFDSAVWPHVETVRNRQNATKGVLIRVTGCSLIVRGLHVHCDHCTGKVPNFRQSVQWSFSNQTRKAIAVMA